LLHRFPAVSAFGDDFEAVCRREDPCQAGADDGLVVDKSD
jgi:hypothetical protein